MSKRNKNGSGQANLDADAHQESSSESHRGLLSTAGASGLWKFNGKDYKSWRYLLMLVLEAEGLDSLIEKDNRKTDAASKRDNARAKLLIAGSLHQSHLSYAQNSTSASGLIKALDEMYLEKGTAGRVQLRTAWQNLRMKDGEDLEAHLRKFDQLTGDLRSLGVDLNDEQVFDQLLMSMPKSFDVTVQILESMSDCGLEIAKGKLRNQFERMRPAPESAQADSTPSNSSFVASNVKCYKCGKMGHVRSQCRSKRSVKQSDRQSEGTRNEREPVKCYRCGGKGHVSRDCATPSTRNDQRSDDAREQQKQSSDEKTTKQSFFSFMASSVKSNSKKALFVIDSGATSHYINDESLFVKSITLKKPNVVNIFKRNISVEVTKVGSVICSADGNEFELQNCQYSKDFPVNLLSVKRMCRAGLDIHFCGENVEVLKNGRLLFRGVGTGDDLYHVECDAKMKHSALAAVSEGINLWHDRLGHPGVTKMRKMAQIIDEKLNVGDKFFCRHCVKGKQTKSPQVSIGSRSSRPLELIHTDVLEVLAESYDGSRYALTFIDDFTGFVTLYLLKRKDEVFDSFQEYYARAKALFNRGITEIRCDRGTEYLNNKFKNFCREKGIRIGATVGYSPKSNGRSERMNRTLLDKARTMLIACGLDEKFWPEAMMCSSFLVNRVINANDVIPAEKWYGRKVNYSRFRTFGCNAYLFVPKEKRKNKVAERSKKYVFVGYDWNGYRLLDEETEKVMIGRDVRFEENSVSLIDVYDDDYDGLKPDDSETLVENLDMENSTWMAYFISGEKVPSSYEEAMNCDESEKWTEATNEELSAIERNNVWEVVEAPHDENILTTKWVYRVKDDQTPKARLVVRGFEEGDDFENDETYAPVAKMTSVRVFLNLSLEFNSKVRQLDVRNAFLNGPLNRQVYIKIPSGVRISEEKKFTKPALRLKKALYGLKEAPKCWNETLNKFLVSIGFKRCKFDDCIYTDGKVYLLIYVDDILIIEKVLNQMEETIARLKKQFDCKDLGVVGSYLGLKIECSDGVVKIGQEEMINRVAKAFGVDSSNPVHTPMESRLQISLDDLKKNENVEPKFRKLLGSLMYIMLGSRPDICFSVSYFSQFSNYADKTTYGYLLRVLKYVYTTKNLRLVYQKSEKESQELEVYVDADWANCPSTRRSFSGYAVFMSKNLIAWRTCKQSLITLSSTDAEIVALCDAVCGALSISNLLREMKIQLQSIRVFEDNANCVRFAQGCTKRSKHLDIKFYFVRDLVFEKKIVVQKIDGKCQVADTLTKGLDRVDFTRLRNNLRVY